MADITMCDNQECKHRDTCYRAKAIPSDYQSWALFHPDDTGECDDYIKYVPHLSKAEIAKTW